MRMLETDRLLLRPVEEYDLKELLELQWDKSLMKFMKFKPLSMENQKEWIKSLGKNNATFVIVLKENNKYELIGLATLNQIDQLHQRASWGMKLKSNIQSKGVGFEASLILLNYAFSNLNLEKIHGDILFENIANRKMCKKVGVVEEGVLRSHYYQNGKFRDVVIVGILKKEFYEINKDELTRLDILME
jgi:RimJ/RimL family protein N-acetyltransferase